MLIKSRFRAGDVAGKRCMGTKKFQMTLNGESPLGGDSPQKKALEGKNEFKDLMGSMLNIGTQHFSEEDLNEEDFN